MGPTMRSWHPIEQSAVYPRSLHKCKLAYPGGALLQQLPIMGPNVQLPFEFQIEWTIVHASLLKPEVCLSTALNLLL